MAFTDKETGEILETLESHFWKYRRPSMAMREQMREGQRIDDESIVLFFERPLAMKPGKWISHEFAKIDFDREKESWTIFWQRANGDWHSYIAVPETETLSEALRAVHEDKFDCFFG